MEDLDLASVRLHWDHRLETAHPGSCYYLVTSKECQDLGWDRETHLGPYALKSEALENAKWWNEAAFGEYCTGHQITPYVEVVRLEK